jgi:hypothetical protein
LRCLSTSAFLSRIEIFLKPEMAHILISN